MDDMKCPDGAFTSIVIEHQSALYTLARRLTMTHADAEDLVAEALLKVWRAMGEGQVPDDLGLRPWLVTVLLNVHRNRVRTTGRRVDERATAALPEPDQARTGATDAMDSSVERLRLERALDRLPERQRVAVVLRHVLDLPAQEVAVALGCTPSTARSLCRRGLMFLRDELGEDL